MGETKTSALRVDFERSLKLEFHGFKVTSDAGLLVYRELNHPLPDITTWSIVTLANMTKTEFKGMKITQDPVGRRVRTRVNSASDGCY